MISLKYKTSALPTQAQFEELFEKVIIQNRIFGDCRIRLTIFREDGGLYTPIGNKPQYLIEASPLETKAYELNKKGLLSSVFQEESKLESA